MLSRDALNALWPTGDFWTPLADDDYDLLLEGVSENSEAARLDVNKIRYLRDPSRTPILDDLEREFAIIPVPGATEIERRSRLAVEMFRRGELPTYDMLQEKLIDAGFDVLVHANDPAVDPSMFIEQAFQMMCDELLPGGNEAQCGEVEAYCGQIGGELLVNGDIYEQAPNYTILCDEALAQCGETEALCGQFDSIRLTPIEYDIPEEYGYWPLIFFVGGEATYGETGLGIRWISKLAVEQNLWDSIAYGNGVFVAVATTGTNRIMRSIDDGKTWNAVASTEANVWYSVAYGNGVFIAVSGNGVNRTMWSDDDGLTWNAVAASEQNNWQSIAYGNGVFIAVAADGVNRTMWSDDDGLTWNAVAATEANQWAGIAYGNGVFIAISTNGVNRTMWSNDDGLTWNAVAAAEPTNWNDITYGNGVFIAIATTGVNRTMWSDDDGLTWNAVAAAEQNFWTSIAYGNGVFIAVAWHGINRIMRSIDNGLTWNRFTAPEQNLWLSVAYGNGVFIAVSGNGTNRVMRSESIIGITNIDIAPIPIERRLEFRRLILKHKPMASWGALIVVYQ